MDPKTRRTLQAIQFSAIFFLILGVVGFALAIPILGALGLVVGIALGFSAYQLRAGSSG